MRFILKLFHFLVLSVVWLVIYAKAVELYFYKIWGFRIYNHKQWDMIPAEWKNGWIIDTPSEFFFFFSIAMILPVFAIGLAVLLRAPWGKFYNNIYHALSEKKKVRHRQKIDKFPSAEELAKVLLEKVRNKKKKIGKDKMPPRMDGVVPLTQHKIREELPKTEQKKLPKEEPPTLEDVAKTDSDALVASATLPEPKMTSRIEVKYAVLSQAEAAGLRIVQEVKIGVDIIDFALITEGAVYLINLEPVGAEWVADEIGFENDEPLWFSETKYETSPVFKLLRATRYFESVLKDILGPDRDKIAVKKMFLIGGGTILNYDDISDTWEDSEVETYRLKGGRPETVPLFDDFLDEQKAKGKNSDDIIEKIYTALVAVEP